MTATTSTTGNARCPDFATRNLPCKHIHSVQFSLKLKGDIELEATEKAIERAEPKITCPYCKSANVISRGKRKNQKGKVQRYGCKNCQRRFTRRTWIQPDEAQLLRQLLSPLTFTSRDYRSRKIVDHLKQFHKVIVVHSQPLSGGFKKYPCNSCRNMPKRYQG